MKVGVFRTVWANRVGAVARTSENQPPAAPQDDEAGIALRDKYRDVGVRTSDDINISCRLLSHR